MKRLLTWGILTVTVATMMLMTPFAITNNKIFVIGDSYSTFDEMGTYSEAFYYPFHSKGNDVTEKSQTWREVLAKKAGMTVIGVDAYSGSSITEREGDKTPSMVSRIKAAPEKHADIIILMGGLNDAWQEVEIGKTDQKYAVESECNKFAPALRYALRLLKEKNPNSKIIYSLIVYDRSVEAYQKAAETICKEENVIFVPISGMKCVSYHPTVKGMEQIADALLPYL